LLLLLLLLVLLQVGLCCIPCLQHHGLVLCGLLLGTLHSGTHRCCGSVGCSRAPHGWQALSGPICWCGKKDNKGCDHVGNHFSKVRCQQKGYWQAPQRQPLLQVVVIGDLTCKGLLRGAPLTYSCRMLSW
jgi:hypothetical protein